MSSFGLSATVSRGNTIIIAQLATKVEQVVYSPVSNSYGKQLLSKYLSKKVYQLIQMKVEIDTWNHKEGKVEQSKTT